MKHFNSDNFGYSLVEVLIAISILLITIVGPLTIAQKGLQNASFAKQQNIAFFLAQEALEGVFKLREDQALMAYVAAQDTRDTSFDSWEEMEELDQNAFGNAMCTAEDPCGIDIEDEMSLFPCADATCDLYFHETGRTRIRHDVSGTPTIYNRQVILDSDSDRVHVRSIVTWGPREDQRIELETFIYNIYAN